VPDNLPAKEKVDKLTAALRATRQAQEDAKKKAAEVKPK
jgi:hypothetical protein